ncbi:MAG: hypothetical protein M1828_000143 [Chrysothrix sp. TS-e1954]|nr:MAG: hypothetical protein M1828_000143 [Chrysothrix sp. TS-e1954]
MTDDQRKLTRLRDNVEQLQEKSVVLEALLHTVQSANAEESAEVFRRLRSGTDLHVVAEQVQAGRLLSGVGLRKGSNDSAQPLSPLNPSNVELPRPSQADRLIKMLATSNSVQVTDIIRRMRNGEDPGSILSTLGAAPMPPKPLLKRASPPGIETHYSRQDRLFGMVKGADVGKTHVADMSGSEFIVSQTSRPWTTVTNDQDLIGHLLNLYFSWQHSFFQSFPEKLFRSDMAAGRTKFCSSILVNAICAAGCFLSAREQVRQDGPAGKDLMMSFYDQCTKLLAETDVSTITTTAALYLMSYVEGTRGRLSGLWTFSGRSTLMAVDINLHLQRNPKPTSSPEEEEDRKNEEKTRLHAFWGCFHVDQTTSFTLGRQPNLNVNGVTVALPEAEPLLDDEPWEAYETTLEARPGARASTFRQAAVLSKIVNSTLLMFFAPSVPLNGSLLLEEYGKYRAWYRDLPDIIRHTKNAPPHVISLHMYFHTAVLLLFRPFLKATIVDSEVVPRDICRTSANAISDIWTQHRELYEYKGIYMFQVHCLLTACTIHIINIPSISATTYLSTACNIFQDLTGVNEWAKSSLGILRGLAKSWSLILPTEVEEAMNRNQEGSESPPIAQRASVGIVGQTPLNHAMPTDPANAYRSMSMSTNYFAQQEHMQQQHAINQQQTQSPTQPQDATSGAVPSKRPQAPNTQLAAPKRQRLSIDQTNIPPTANQQAHFAMQTAQNFLYSPLAGQPAPLLMPGRSSIPTNMPNRPAPPASAGAPEMGKAPTAQMTSSTSAGAGVQQGVEKVEGVAQQQQQQQPQQQQQLQQHPQLQQQQQQQQQGAADVDGLTFEDDWRDPFMGYLGQTG